MPKPIVLLAALAVSAAILVPAAPTRAGTDELCAARWPGDGKMQRRCVRRQDRAMDRVAAFIKRHDLSRKRRVSQRTGIPDPHIMMVARCNDRTKVKRFGTFDWVKFVPCLRREEKAYNAKHGIADGKKTHGPYGKPPGDRLEDKLGPFE